MVDEGIDVKKVGMLGVGSMGAMMALLLGELGIEVYYHDPSDKNMDTLEQQSKDIKLDSKLHRSKDYSEVCKHLEQQQQQQQQRQPKVFLLSTPHGAPADKCVASLSPHLRAGDVIVDCGNEHWLNTERRQRGLGPRGIHYVGCGVSGGYQSARHGPSMAPGGSAAGLAAAMPLLERMAARDRRGRPCVVPVGPGGSGHYVKMVHNGVEQAMMSAVAEVWALLAAGEGGEGLGLAHDEVAAVFDSWNRDGGVLHDSFLVAIGARIERAKDGDGEPLVERVRDKVTQDVTEEEGTGTWTCEEAVALHVPAASIVSAHLFRCASADLARRIRNRKAASGGGDGNDSNGPSRRVSVESKEHFIEVLRRTTYFCFLEAFAQGLDLIRARDRREGWDLDYARLLQLWRGGCIIQADHIADLLEGVFVRRRQQQQQQQQSGGAKKNQNHGRDAEDEDDGLLSSPEVGRELAAHFPAAKEAVLRAVEADFSVPAVSQTLEHYKYATASAQLPTQFMEAQLDYFGQHMFDDARDDPVGGPEKGRHHFEWQPARGISGK